MLIAKDIEKKKEALEEEKALIDERLQKRREAEDMGKRYEDLAEYQRQLSMISMDPTRTKDAAKLREQIADLEKEIAWELAEEEAEAVKQAINDELEAYDKRLLEGEEDLQALMEDAQNFADEVNEILGLSQEELFEWLKENVKEYMLALADQQEQMVKGWEDTYKQMYGITDTYWDQIQKILEDKNTFLEFMKYSQEFMTASKTQMDELFYTWETMYDKMLAAHMTDAEYDHTDPGIDGTTGTTGGGQSKGRDGEGTGWWDGTRYVPYDEWFATHPRTTTTRTITLPVRDPAVHTPSIVDPMERRSGRPGPVSEWIIGEEPAPVMERLRGYASGGLASNTGLAWLDGSLSDPERVLSPDQTKAFDQLVSLLGNNSPDQLISNAMKNMGTSIDDQILKEMEEASRFVTYKSSMNNINSDSYSRDDISFGDIVITINQATLNDDEDIEDVAERVGEIFAKELSKKGMLTTNFAF